MDDGLIYTQNMILNTVFTTQAKYLKVIKVFGPIYERLCLIWNWYNLYSNLPSLLG